MPEPGEGESEEDFISRCMRVVRGEGLNQTRAAGKCYGIWRGDKGEKDEEPKEKKVDG